jgi:MFS family permease
VRPRVHGSPPGLTRVRATCEGRCSRVTIRAAVPSTLARTLGVLRTVFANPELRRVEIAYAGFCSAEWAVWIAMLVFAYEQGGTTTAGIVAVVQLVPAALFAPFGSVLADRYRAGRVLFWSYVAQAVAMAVTAALLLSGGPAYLAYAAAAVAATAVTVTRPTMSGLTPSLARRPEELTSVNVASNWIESVCIFLAPALTGVLLAVSVPGAVFAVMAAAVAVGAALVFPVRGPLPAGHGEVREAAHTEVARAMEAVRSESTARVLIVIVCADLVVLGALDVLYPQLAIDTLGQSSSWAAYLNAAFGAGAVAAVFVTSGLVGKPRLLPSMLLGIALYAGAFLVFAAYQALPLAVAVLAAAGLGRAMLDVGARTLLQRVAPPDMLARVFGLVEAIAMAALAVGSLGVTLLVAVGGVSLALAGIGLLLPLAVLVGGRSLLDIDRHADVPVVEIGLLRSLPLFAPLPPQTLESAARSLRRADVGAGSVVIREGQEGDRFYVIADGSIEVTKAGARLALLGRGDGFGEIALLYAAPRNATCTAVTDVTLYALERDDFLAVITGHPRSTEEAERLAAVRTEEANRLAG